MKFKANYRTAKTLDNEISELGSMALQMLMARSKLLQTASDIDKTLSDTATQMIENIKQ